MILFYWLSRRNATMTDKLQYMDTLKRAYTKLQKFLPLVTIDCVDGSIETKVLSLYDDNEALKMLFEETIVDKNDPKVLDVSDLGIRIQEMTYIIRYIENPSLGRFCFREKGSVSYPKHAKALVAALLFLDKFLLVDHLNTLIQDLSDMCRYISDLKVIIHLAYLMVHQNVLHDSLYALAIQKARTHFQCQSILRTLGATYKDPEAAEKVIQDIMALEDHPTYQKMREWTKVKYEDFFKVHEIEVERWK